MAYFLTSATRDIADYIDLSVLESFWEMQQNGRPDLLSRIIGTVLRTSPDFLADIRSAIETNDAAALRNAAHTMKSSNGQIGARRMAALCYELESMGRTGTIADGAIRRMAELDAEWQKVEQALTCILGQLGSR